MDNKNNLFSLEKKTSLNKEETIIADFHIHSRFSRACSKDLNIPNLVKWARIKGLDLLGTGDFTHPEWVEELRALKEVEGILWYEEKTSADKSEIKRFPFILSSEISLIYTEYEHGRKVHLVYLAPNLEAADKINKYLDSKGRRDYDGRPIFKISCRDFAEAMEKIDDKIEIIPAHIWTPYFGIFGSKSGFDSLEEAFKDKLKNIHVIETGISSDPAMNWTIKDLENIGIVSFSDAHSYWPWRLGREATIFYLPENKTLSYDFILKQIREKTFKATIEADPAYGKYHFDGHMGCNFSCSPDETKKLNGICPKCQKPLTIGVDNRVEELAEKEKSEHKYKKKYYKILPLHELISLALGIGINSKGCWKIYNELIENFGTEFSILLDISKENLAKVLKNELLVDLILKNREGKIKIIPGYDGEYGKAILSEKQSKLF